MKVQQQHNVSKLPCSLGTAHAHSYITAFSCGCKKGYWIAKHPPRCNYKIIIQHYIETNPVGIEVKANYEERNKRAHFYHNSLLSLDLLQPTSRAFSFFIRYGGVRPPAQFSTNAHAHSRTPSLLVRNCCTSIFKVRKTNSWWRDNHILPLKSLPVSVWWLHSLEGCLWEFTSFQIGWKMKTILACKVY